MQFHRSTSRPYPSSRIFDLDHPVNASLPGATQYHVLNIHAQILGTDRFILKQTGALR